MTAAESTWAADGRVDVDRVDRVAVVTLNRPPGNGWTPALGVQYFGALDELAEDSAVRAIVVTGAGPSFCIGADGTGLDNIANDGGYEINADRPTYWATTTIGKPVIAAVNGACFGVGMALALLCDIRIAATSTKFATAFARRGLTVELGMTWLLPRIVGLGIANDLLLSGRLVRADEAQRVGLVSQIVDDDALLDAALQYARLLAEQCSPTAMALIKRQIYVDLSSTLPGAVARGDAHMEASMTTDDFAEGIRSWRDGRNPAFSELDPRLARFPIPGEHTFDEEDRR